MSSGGLRYRTTAAPTTAVNSSTGSSKNDKSSSLNSKNNMKIAPKPQKTPNLPVIIFPGFMSSGLYVKESTVSPGWVNKRLWINLVSLGISSIHFGGSDVATTTAISSSKISSSTSSSTPPTPTVDRSGYDDDKDDDKVGNPKYHHDETNVNGCIPSKSSAETTTTAAAANATTTPQSPTKTFYTNSNHRQQQSKNEAEGKRMRSLWLQHIMLKNDLVTEPDGVQVRNIEGLAGVDYLSPGTLTNHVSYVFGPVIDALKLVGYDNNFQKDTGGGDSVYNLDAAPYDWRLPPHALEERDSYVTRTMRKIENLYEHNNDTPVVMVCHSLGCKTGHYFLNHVEKHVGRAWIDKYIHSYMPVGAPHLGAPSAVRSLVAGEKMGLDTFLSDAESLAFGRTIGSGPFLLPSTLPPGAPSTVYLRNEGAIEVWLSLHINVQPLFERRLEGHAPQKLKLTVVYNNKQSASSSWTTVEGDVESASQTVTFTEKFVFSVPPDGPPKNARLTFLLCEPGVRSARASDTAWTRAHRAGRRNFFTVWEYNDCECYDATRGFIMNLPGSYLIRHLMLCPIICPMLQFIIWPIFYFFMQVYFGISYAILWVIFRGSLLSYDELAKLSGKSSVAAYATVKNSPYYDLGDMIGNTTREIHTDMIKKGGGCCGPKATVPLSFHIRFIPPNDIVQNTICSPVGQPSSTNASSTIDRSGEQNKSWRVVNLTHPKNDEISYEARTAFDMISREGVDTTFTAIQKQYDTDPLDPRGRTSFGRPPVRRIKAVYGINLPTEVGAVYRRHNAVVDRHDKVLNLHRLDTEAIVADQESGYITKGGKVMETKDTLQPDGTKISGDGTVPYWSMRHVKTWNSDDCQVTVDTLDRAPHREILADPRFHELLTSYVCHEVEAAEDNEEQKKDNTEDMSL